MERSDGKYNHQAEYFLCSVKQRNMTEFLDALKKEKRRHAESKADLITALGLNQLHKKGKVVDLAELFYCLNSYNSISTEQGGYFYLNRLKKIIMEQIEKDYQEMELPMPDSDSFLELQDKTWSMKTQQ